MLFGLVLIFLGALVGYLVRDGRRAEAVVPSPQQHSPPAPPSGPRRVATVPKKAPSEPTDATASLLREAIEARASGLGACWSQGLSLPKLPSRLRVRPDGTVRSVEWVSAAPVDARVSDCLRQTILGWRLTGIDVSRDTEVLVTFVNAP